MHKYGENYCRHHQPLKLFLILHVETFCLASIETRWYLFVRDFCGMITKTEFLDGVRAYFPESMLKRIPPKDLQALFDNHDVDKSGYVTASIFPPVVEALLNALVK